MLGDCCMSLASHGQKPGTLRSILLDTEQGLIVDLSHHCPTSGASGEK